MYVCMYIFTYIELWAQCNKVRLKLFTKIIYQIAKSETL